MILLIPKMTYVKKKILTSNKGHFSNFFYWKADVIKNAPKYRKVLFLEES